VNVPAAERARLHPNLVHVLDQAGNLPQPDPLQLDPLQLDPPEDGGVLEGDVRPELFQSMSNEDGIDLFSSDS
jgi:hypothetical protein